jgi:2-phosphosulfolactate phosphatase
VRDRIGPTIHACGSGKQLIERGFERDVAIASELNVSRCVPVLVEQAYVDRAG